MVFYAQSTGAVISGRARERERERERQTDRQTDRQTQRERERERETLNRMLCNTTKQASHPACLS